MKPLSKLSFNLYGSLFFLPLFLLILSLPSFASDNYKILFFNDCFNSPEFKKAETALTQRLEQNNLEQGNSELKLKLVEQLICDRIKINNLYIANGSSTKPFGNDFNDLFDDIVRFLSVRQEEESLSSTPQGLKKYINADDPDGFVGREQAGQWYQKTLKKTSSQIADLLNIEGVDGNRAYKNITSLIGNGLPEQSMVLGQIDSSIKGAQNIINSVRTRQAYHAGAYGNRDTPEEQRKLEKQEKAKAENNDNLIAEQSILVETLTNQRANILRSYPFLNIMITYVPFNESSTVTVELYKAMNDYKDSNGMFVSLVNKAIIQAEQGNKEAILNVLDASLQDMDRIIRELTNSES